MNIELFGVLTRQCIQQQRVQYSYDQVIPPCICCQLFRVFSIAVYPVCACLGKFDASFSHWQNHDKNYTSGFD